MEKFLRSKLNQSKVINPLQVQSSKLKDFEDFLEAYADKIVQKWIDYFVYHKDVEFEKINTRIK